jgi:hypothetical protein
MKKYYTVLYNGKPIKCNFASAREGPIFETITLKRMKPWDIWELLGY